MAPVDMRTLRTQYRSDLQQDGTISSAEAEALAKGAESAEGRAFLEQRLEQDSFDPKARATLDQAIQKHETAAEKKLDQATGLGPSGIVGLSAGTVGKLDVTVKRDLGPREGFDSREQARAAAVLTGKPTALVRDKAGRWHLGELSIDPKTLSGTFAPNAAGLKTELVKQPDQAQLDRLKTAYDDASSEEKPEAYRKLVVATLGLDDKDVVFAADAAHVQAGKVNVTFAKLDGGDASGQSGYVAKGSSSLAVALPTDRTTDPGPSTIVLGLGAQGSTRNFQDLYVHEATHQAHGERAKALLEQWRNDTGAGKMGFDEWLLKQHAAGKVSDTDFKVTQQAANAAGGVVSPRTTATEALAYTRAFISAYGNQVQLERPGVKPDLNYTFNELLGAGEAKHEPPDEVKQELRRQLQQMFDGLPAGKQQEFKDYTAAHFQKSWLKDVLPS